MSIVEVRQLLSSGFTTTAGHRMQLIDTEQTYETTTSRMRLFRLPGDVPVLTWLDKVTGQVRVFVDAQLDTVDGKFTLIEGLEIAPSEWN